MSKNSTWESTVKPVVVLSVIALLVSLLLALVNSFTAPIIEENLKAATLAAYVDVMPTVSSASDLDEVTLQHRERDGRGQGHRWQHRHQGRGKGLRRRYPVRHHGL